MLSVPSLKLPPLRLTELGPRPLPSNATANAYVFGVEDVKDMEGLTLSIKIGDVLGPNTVGPRQKKETGVTPEVCPKSD